MRVFEILEELVRKHPNICSRDPYWWPNSGSFEVLVGAILTQQTKWENVEKSLQNLRNYNLLTLEKIAECEISILSDIIKPSGFYNMKAERLKYLCVAIYQQFGDFENFRQSVNRDWLLNQKGIGLESADSILCYACKKDIMVVDSYTFRLFKTELDIEDMQYDELRELIESEIESNYENAANLLHLQSPTLCQIYAIFHGLIVEFCKSTFKGRVQRMRLLGEF